VDLTKIDRAIAKEPKYTTEPRYALLVFGPTAEKRVWLVLDGEVLYVDRNGNGDLTEVDERVALTAKASKKGWEGPMYKEMNFFDIGTVAGQRLRLDFWVFDKDYVPKTDSEKERVKAHQEKGREYATLRRTGRIATLSERFWGEDQTEMYVTFCPRPEDAEICHFAGQPTFQLIWNNFKRDSDATIRVVIGTPGLLARDSSWPANFPFAELTISEVPADVHPVADFEFANKDATQPPIKLHVVVNQRCCGLLFNGDVRVPPEAAIGKAKVTVSFPAWKEGDVVPATFEIRIEEATATSAKQP
jgi:hypothetical protein